MNRLLKDGNKFVAKSFEQISEVLPVGVYTVNFNPIDGYYLEQGKDFKLPEKIYNSPVGLIKRYLTTFSNTEKNLGIILTGVKGSGKTITAELLCKEANLPVLIITQPYRDEGFKLFLTNPCFSNCIVLIDEFEKIYNQNTDINPENGEDKGLVNLLSIMDGMYNTKLMFVLTTNSDKISEFLINRPGRVRYRKNYDYLTKEEAKEIIDDKLIHKELESSIYEALDKYGICTMDILVKLIEDMNLFNEDALICSSYMNLIPENKDYRVSLIYADQEFELSRIYSIKDIKCLNERLSFSDDKEFMKFEKTVSKITGQPLKKIEGCFLKSFIIGTSDYSESSIKLQNDGYYAIYNHTLGYVYDSDKGRNMPIEVTIKLYPEQRFTKWNTTLVA